MKKTFLNVYHWYLFSNVTLVLFSPFMVMTDVISLFFSFKPINPNIIYIFHAFSLAFSDSFIYHYDRPCPFLFSHFGNKLIFRRYEGKRNRHQDKTDWE